MEHIISSVAPGSIAQEMGIEPGDRLLEVNGKSPEDVFDYRYLMNEEEILVLIRKANGEEWELEIEKEYEDIDVIYEWCAKHVPWQRDKIKMLPKDQRPRWMEIGRASCRERV